MKELKELLNNWMELPSIETRNAFLTSLWQAYECQFHLWAEGFLRRNKSSKEEAYKADDLNIDFFEKKLIKIKPSTYLEKIELYESFDGWLWTIHKNWCLTWGKQKKNNRRNEGTEELMNIPDTMQADESILHQDLLQLTSTILSDNPLQYKAWVLSYHGFSMKDIAVELGKTVEGVRGLIKRARQKLKKAELLYCTNDS